MNGSDLPDARCVGEQTIELMFQRCSAHERILDVVRPAAKVHLQSTGTSQGNKVLEECNNLDYDRTLSKASDMILGDVTMFSHHNVNPNGLTERFACLQSPSKSPARKKLRLMRDKLRNDVNSVDDNVPVGATLTDGFNDK